MSNTHKSGLVAKQRLTSAEIAQIEQLAQQCDVYDHATLRVNWDALAARPEQETNDFLYYEDGVLVGALALYSFSRREAEASGMVQPEQRRRGIFRALVAAGVEELRRRGIPRLVFFCDHKSGPGIAFLEAIGARYEYSEYRMDLEEARMPRSFDEHLHVNTATEADVDAIAHIAAVSFEGDEEETRQYVARSIHNPARRYIIARLDAEPVGSLNLSVDEQEVGIYGFGVLPEYRGRSR
jgi:ribosomal protein S18 acetylase RimI-like enzyme